MNDLVASSARQLALLEQGRQMIAEACTIGEALELRNQAEAIEHYLKQRGDGEETARNAGRLVLWAERRVGQLLKEIPREQGKRTDQLHLNVKTKLEEAVPDRNERAHFQRIESIPESAFIEYLESSAWPTRNGALKIAATHSVRQKKKSKKKLGPPIIEGDRWKMERADCLDFLARQPAGSIDLIFGSPPYEDARLYLEDGQDTGAARDTEQWVSWMVKVFEASLACCKGLVAFVVAGRTKDYCWSGSPALLMAALIGKGISLRCPPLYRRVGIPGSGGPDWLRNDYEFIICATNGGQLPWSDNTAMGHAPKYEPGGDPSHRTQNGQRVNRPDGYATMNDRNNQGPHRARQRAGRVYQPPERANPGNVIDCVVGGGSMGSKLCHENEAPFPEALAEFFVRSFCRPGGTVCDPFAGSGTTLAVAVAQGRLATGCDLRDSQVKIVKKRLRNVTPPLFTEV